MNTRFVQTSPEYGDCFAGVKASDYPVDAGVCFESYDGIYQRNNDGPDIRVAVPVLDFEWSPHVVWTVTEAAEWFGVARGTLRAALQRGALDGRKSGKTWLVFREDVRLYLRRTHGL